MRPPLKVDKCWILKPWGAHHGPGSWSQDPKAPERSPLSTTVLPECTGPGEVSLHPATGPAFLPWPCLMPAPVLQGQRPPRNECLAWLPSPRSWDCQPGQGFRTNCTWLSSPSLANSTSQARGSAPITWGPWDRLAQLSTLHLPSPWALAGVGGWFPWRGQGPEDSWPLGSPPQCWLLALVCHQQPGRTREPLEASRGRLRRSLPAPPCLCSFHSHSSLGLGLRGGVGLPWPAQLCAAQLPHRNSPEPGPARHHR